MILWKCCSIRKENNPNKTKLSVNNEDSFYIGTWYFMLYIVWFSCAGGRVTFITSENQIKNPHDSEFSEMFIRVRVKALNVELLLVEYFSSLY